MPNRPIPIELDKTRHLYFDFNALVTVGDNIDIPIQELFADWQKAANFKTVRALLLGGLIHEDETLTAKQVGDMLTPLLKKPDALVKIGQVIRQALAAAFTDETGESEKKDKGQDPTPMIPKNPGRGKNS